MLSSPFSLVRVVSTADVLLAEDVTGRGHATRQLSEGARRSASVALPDEALARRS